MSRSANDKMRDLARLARIMAEQALSAHAAAEARRRALAREIDSLRQQLALSPAAEEEEGAKVAAAIPPSVAERHRQWCRSRLTALEAQLETASTLGAQARAQAARAHGRAEVLAGLAGRRSRRNGL